MATSTLSQTRVCRILLVGDSAVGKTSAVCSYLGESFNPVHDPTIGLDFKNHTIKQAGTDGACSVELEIFDTSGQDCYKTITTAYYVWAYCFLLMFDLTNVESFRSLSKWFEAIEAMVATTQPKPPPKILIIGNKKDLEQDRSITFEEASECAKALGCSYIESSAKEGTCIQECFEMLIEGSRTE